MRCLRRTGMMRTGCCRINMTFTLIDDPAASTKIDGFDAKLEAINTPLYTQFVEELAVTMKHHLRGLLVHER